MNLLSIYVIMSALLLAWVASFWSSSGLLNTFIKTCFALGALFGAVCASKLLF